MGTLCCGVFISVSLLTRKRRRGAATGEEYSSLWAYWDSAAFCEATVAISSGALLWIGFWDIMDAYVVPKEWWGKLCMMGVGFIGAIFTRSLYDVQQVEERTVVHAVDDTATVNERGPRTPKPPGSRDPGVRAIMTPHRAVLSLEAAEEMVLEEGRASPRRKCFNAPPFSSARCVRALLATFSGLTIWVGLWDLLDYHVLPALVPGCLHEPNLACAALKLVLVALGALGLFCTRSLYGSSDTLGVTQFSPIN